MQLFWFVATVTLCLQLAWTRTLQSIENNRDSDNDNTVAVPLILVYGGFHYAEIGIGTPPQMFKVFFDTFKPNSWITSTKCPVDKYKMCANHKRYDANKSTTSNETLDQFACSQYGTLIYGNITVDDVKLGGQSVRQAFGEVTSTIFDTLDTATFDGVFGVGFDKYAGHPTILQSMIDSGIIKKKVFGIYAKGNAYGEIMFGGYNSKLYNGDIEFTKLSAEDEWMFDVKSIKFGDQDLTGEECQAVLNDGSHHIYGPPEQVNKIYKALNCSKSDLCKVDCNKIKTFPDLKIIVNKKEIIIRPQDYIDKGGDECTSRILDTDQRIWMFGNLFLDKVYTAYDVEHKQVGFALAKAPLTTLSPTPRPTTATTTASTTDTTTTREPTTTTTQGPEPTTTSAASTLFSHHKSVELALVMTVLGYLQMYTP